MPSNNSLVLPLVLWDNIAPTCNISSLIINESETNLITGTTSGHIIIWDFNLENITPICVLMGHTSVVNCLARAGLTKTEEYFVSSSENGEMKLWELNEKICLEYNKTSNNVHKNIYVSDERLVTVLERIAVGDPLEVSYRFLVTQAIYTRKPRLRVASTRVHGKYTRLFCIGNYTDVLIIDPMTLDIIYTLVSREQHQWINALCINTLPNKNDEVIVGVSVSGVIKLWTLGFNEPKGAEIIEHEYKHCECDNARTLISCPGKHRIFLVVCAKYFQIFDAFDFTVLCYMHCKNNETFNSGYFIDIDKLLISTNDGISYIYELPENANPHAPEFRHKVGRHEVEKCVPKLLTTLRATIDSQHHNHKFYSPPIFYFYERKIENQLKAKNYLIRGDCNGHFALWNLNNPLTEKLESYYDQSLQKFWHQNVKKDEEDIGHVSTFLFLPNLDKLIYGTIDGAIVILSALDYLMSRLFEMDNLANKKLTKPIKLKKHTSKVTTLLYPNAENPRYDPSLFVSGGVDFSVILWNINTGNLIHKFVVQAGEILQLSVPPNNVNPRISQCICSIASDNSVALLSLKECKPVMVASRHLFPVLFVKWRPLDDYLIVKCTDGGVYVWQMETGNLDRVAHGLIAEDIISAADELTYESTATQPQSAPANAQQQNMLNLSNQYVSSTTANKLQTQYVSGNTIANQTVSIANTLQKRNFANAIKLITLKAFNREEEQKKGVFTSDFGSTNFPLVMQTFHFNTRDPVNNLLLFDVDSLLVNLILEEQAIESLLQYIRTNFYNEIHNIQTAPSQLAPLYRTTQDHSGSTIRRIVSAKSWDPTDLKLMNTLKNKVYNAHSIIKITRILLSCLHAWHLDPNLDTLFESKLGLLRPKVPISFGHISRHYHITIMFPKKLTIQTNPFINRISSALIEFTTKDHWSIAKCLTTEHLLSILSIANSFMNLQNFIDLQLKKDCDALDFILGENATHLTTEGHLHGEGQGLLKQTYSRLSTMYCMLADYFQNTSFKSLNLEILAQKWMDPSYEVREAAQSLLKNELKRIGSNGRSALIKHWEPHLNSVLKECEDVTNTSHVSLNNPTNASSPTTPQPQSTNISPLQSQSNLTGNSNAQNVSFSNTASSINYMNMDGAVTGSSLHSQTNNSSSSNTNGTQIIYNESTSRLKRKQYIAIIILGVMGAEFGQDVSTSKTSSSSKTIPQGFSIEDHTILKRISIALAKLLTNKSLQSDVNRRAAIDLMGRGFTIWEPFIQPTYVLLSLLELCADAELYIPRSSLNLPLTPVADTCRTARYSLNLIANTKPKTFILTIAKEVKRINSPTAQTGQNAGQSNFNNALTRGKAEILQIIEKLIDNQAQDVYELLSDVIEIILFCLDTNQVRSNGLEEAFPAVFKFPMVRYCKETRRIIVGCHNGRLIMYEYRTSKWHFQNFPAHNSQPIVAVAISPDSKYIASYSAHDNSLFIWQITSGSIFNIGSGSLKQQKVCTAAPIDLSSSPLTKLATLSWQAKTLNLVYYDGRKFSYQI